jgi:hypothetical protein
LPDRSRALALYKTTAVVVLNTLVLLFVINLVVWGGNRLRYAYMRHGIAEGRQADMVEAQRVHPGMSPDQMQTLDDETFAPVEFEPFTMFREAPRTGDYVNVDSAGFRRVEHQGAWPPDSAMFNIFVFGGSTTFGIGITDAQAVPSVLQWLLSGGACGSRVRVYNFGRGYYYSAQERVLFESLLTERFVPRLAIFLDGFNDAEYGAEGRPELTGPFADQFRETQRQRPSLAAVINAMRWVPLVRASTALSDWLSTTDGAPQPTRAARDPHLQQLAVDRWLETKILVRSAAESHLVHTVFVWQPVSRYEYDLKYHLMRDPSIGPDATAAVYTLMDARRKAGELSDVLWLADMQEGRHEALYVDDIHYTAAFAAEIAGRIATWLREHKLVC